MPNPSRCPLWESLNRQLKLEYSSSNNIAVLAQDILNTFDQLPHPKQLEIAMEILKRLMEFDFPPLTDEDLTMNAEMLFLTLDEQEAGDE